MAKSPKWATPHRQKALVQLWAKYGNRCLLGHAVCPNPEHYLHRKPKTAYIAEPVKIPCRDKADNPIRDKDGKPLYITLYRPKPVRAEEVSVSRLYDVKADEAIAYWVADDRAQREAEWRLLERAMHGLAERGPLRGQFSAIARDIFYARQPQYYLLGLGVSGLTFKPFALVRIASSPVQLHVDLGDTLRKVSKNRRRKAIRHGKPLPQAIAEAVDEACKKAVRDWLRS